jgi:hypothetical protein
MVVVSSKEFRTNQKKYLNLAIDQQVFIKRGQNTFIVTCADNGLVHWKPNKETLEAMKEAKESQNLETLDLDKFEDFIASL